MKMNFRKIASVLTSTIMLSSTVALAAAANYPAPFVQSGSANVAVVYGSNAAITDVAAVVDINSNLATKLAEQTASGGTGQVNADVSGGDYVALEKPSDKINLGNVVSTVFGSTVSKDDLKDLLADGVYSNDENTEYKYEQKITLGNWNLDYFSNSEYQDRAPTVGINLSSNQLVLTYKLDFQTDAASDVTSGDLVDLETTNIHILGRDYYILDFDNSTLEATLLDAANSASIKEGETKSVSVGDKKYDVSINFIGSSTVKLVVNGEVTNSLSAGGTQKLADGSYLGIKEINVQDYAGGSKEVEFSIGTGKLKIRSGGSDIEVNDKAVTGVAGWVARGTPSGGQEKIDLIGINWTTSDVKFITPESDLTMPGFGSLKLSMTPFKGTTEEKTTVEADGADSIALKTTIKDGEVTLPILYGETVTGNFTGIGKDSSNRLATFTGTLSGVYNYTLGDRYLVASWNSTTAAESYVLRFTNFVNNSDTRAGEVDIQKMVNGEFVNHCEKKKAGDTCNLGSLSLTVNSVIAYGSDKWATFTGGAGASFSKLFTKEGLLIHLPYNGTNSSYAAGIINFTTATSNIAGHNGNTYRLVFWPEDKDGNLAAGTPFNVTLDNNANFELEVSNINPVRTAITDPDDSNHKIAREFADVSTKMERFGQSSDQRYAVITYPGSQTYSQILLTDSRATVANGTTTTTGGSVRELGTVRVADNEAATVADKNLIVVGGSCINSVAAQLLGGALCGADFTTKTGVDAGSFLIQTFDRGNSRVATLVAGYNAADTVNAAKYLITNSVDTTVGKKYKGTSATVATLQTS